MIILLLVGGIGAAISIGVLLAHLGATPVAVIAGAAGAAVSAWAWAGVVAILLDVVTDVDWALRRIDAIEESPCDSERTFA